MFAPSGRVEYRWALDSAGRPVPITAAERGGQYTCPLCRAPMIARLGTQVRHHFSHDSANACDSESVSWAALRRWIALQLEAAMRAGQAVPVKWRCRLCGQQHTANLLDRAAALREDIGNEPLTPDVLITDSAGTVRVAAFIQTSAAIPAEAFQQGPEVYVLRVPVNVELAPPTLAALLGASRLIGAPCPVWAAAGPILREAGEIRAAIGAAVSAPPGHFAVPIGPVGGLNDIAVVGTAKIWAAHVRWQTLFGGLVHRIAPEVEILIDHWALPDGRAVYSYYVQSRKTRALAARCFPAATEPTLRLDERFRQRRTTALDIAQYLVTH